MDNSKSIIVKVAYLEIEMPYLIRSLFQFPSASTLFCTVLLYHTAVTACVRPGVANPPAVFLSLQGFFVNGGLLCYDGRMDEWEGATGEVNGRDGGMHVAREGEVEATSHYVSAVHQGN